MEFNFKKAAFSALIATSVVSLAACGAGNKKADNTSESKELTVAVDKLYVDYMEGIKDNFEKENGVTVNVKAVDQSDVLTNLPIDVLQVNLQML